MKKHPTPTLSLLLSLMIGLFMTTTQANPAHAASRTALFAGGCFWCMQPVFDATEGVTRTEVGYAGGHVANPTYEQVASKKTGHAEVIRITYDDAKVSYEKLVELFFENIDPFDANGQFADKGEPYKTAVFVADDTERATAQRVRDAVQARFPNQKVATLIRDSATFYAAEDYHQHYYKKNSMHYNLYKYGSGRVDRLKEIWGSE